MQISYRTGDLDVEPSWASLPRESATSVSHRPNLPRPGEAPTHPSEANAARSLDRTSEIQPVSTSLRR